MSPASDIPVLPSHVVRELNNTGDWISSWWTVLALAVLAVGLFGLTFWRARRKSGASDGQAEPRRRRRWVGFTAAGVAAVLCLGIAVNAWVGYWPTVAGARMWAAATFGLGDTRHQSTHVLGTEHVGGVDALTIPIPSNVSIPSSITWVYTPPGYSAEDKTTYPVILLAHGSPGSSADWFSGGDAPHILDVLIGAGLIDPMIAVAFDMNGTGAGSDDTECLDSTTGGSQVETYLNSVVLPYIDGNFATNGTRIIGGFSAGAFCALDQGLRHPETYDAIIALAPYLNPGSGGRTALKTEAEFDQHDVAQYVTSLAPSTAPVTLVLTEATPSPALTQVEQVAAQLRTLTHPTLLYAVDGDHNWTWARSVFPAALISVADDLGLSSSSDDATG